MTRFRRAVSFASAFALMLAAVRPAAGDADTTRTHLSGRYYDIETTVVQYSFGSGDFTAPARLTVTRPGLAVAADNAKGNTKTGAAVLRGNVRVQDAGGADGAQGKNAAPATLTCEQLDVDGRADSYRATGRPHYESGSRSADADEMFLDRKHKKLRLTGNVTLKDGEQTGKANAVDVDLKSGDAAFHGDPVQLEAPVAAPRQKAPNPRPTPSAKPRPVQRPSAPPK
ncbi:MAG: hypothetical protein NVS3B7_10730 [Candidatus Elarobacter sp.]